MSQVKIQLRQPPNVDFLEGYPGIPAGPDIPGVPKRPPAALRGEVEVRVSGKEPVKAMWVKIELRKIETLLQGQGGPFVEVIGQAPKIWTAPNGDSQNLYSDAYSFYLTIPDNIPPSIALEKGSGIRYEMVATLCCKGKKGLFRKDATTSYTASAPVVIDKHELHTIWPLYRRPQTNNANNDGLTLVVTREATCFGPGDRVSVRAELRSARQSPCILRSWELTLREHVIFRPDPSQANSKNPGAAQQQYRHNVVAEQKLPLSKTMYEGTSQAADLACLVPFTHRTMTTGGRLIEVHFTLSVKAVMESAGSVEVMIPVLMANWPRDSSTTLLQKIGPVPHLGVPIPPAPPAPSSQPDTQPAWSRARSTSNGQASTAPSLPQPARAQVVERRPGDLAGIADEGAPPSPPYSPPESGSPFARRQGATVGLGGKGGLIVDGMDEFGGASTAGQRNTIGGAVNGRARESAALGRGRPLTVINVDPDAPGTSASVAPPAQEPLFSRKAAWETAEDEKKRLQESFSQNSAPTPQASPPASPPKDIKKPAYPTSEDEKKRLYERAQAQARRTQELARREMGLPALSRDTSTSSVTSSQPRPSTTTSTTSSESIPTTPPSVARLSTAGRTGPDPASYASAEAEKERLFRQAQRRAREAQARLGSPAGSIDGRERSGSTASVTTQRAAGARNSTFKMTNPDVPSEGVRTDTSSFSSPVPQPVRAGPPLISVEPRFSVANPTNAAASAAAAMYAQAMAAARPPNATPSPQPRQSPVIAAPHSTQSSPSPNATPGRKTFMSAEDEKAQLQRYHEAKRAVQTKQGGMASGSGRPISPAESFKQAGGSAPMSTGQFGASSSAPALPLAYSHLMSTVSAAPMISPMANSQVFSSTPGYFPPSNHRGPASSSPPAPSSSFNVVMRSSSPENALPPLTHSQGFNSPDYSYGNQARYEDPPLGAPPSFSATVVEPTPPVPTSEKERLRLYHEAQDAAARYQQETAMAESSGHAMGQPYASASQPPGYDAPPPAFDGPANRPLSALEEKAMLARQAVAQQPPSRAPSIRTPSGPRQSPTQSFHSPAYGSPYVSPNMSVSNSPAPQPAPYQSPLAPPSQPPQQSQPSMRHFSAPRTFDHIEEEADVPMVPPPLMPRPPREYIEEYLEEDDNDRRPTQNGEVQQPAWKRENSSSAYHTPLTFRPMSPFDVPLVGTQPLSPEQYRQPSQGAPAPDYRQPAPYRR